MTRRRRAGILARRTRFLRTPGVSPSVLRHTWGQSVSTLTWKLHSAVVRGFPLRWQRLRLAGRHRLEELLLRILSRLPRWQGFPGAGQRRRELRDQRLQQASPSVSGHCHQRWSWWRRDRVDNGQFRRGPTERQHAKRSCLHLVKEIGRCAWSRSLSR
jgi:hypothetical protein